VWFLCVAILGGNLCLIVLEKEHEQTKSQIVLALYIYSSALQPPSKQISNDASPPTPLRVGSHPGQLRVEMAGDTFSLKFRDRLTGDGGATTIRPSPRFLNISSVLIPIRSPMGEVLCWTLVRYSRQSRWPTIYMQGSLSNAGAVLRRCWRRGERVDGI